MGKEPLVNLNEVDFSKLEFTKDEINKVNPHRFEMEQIDGIIRCDIENGIIIGYKDVKGNEFWVRGHIPGMPILPGVIMIEASAQLCNFLYKKTVPETGNSFVAFGGVDSVRFRGVVKPAERIIFIGKKMEMSRRISKCQTQGFVNYKLVYEGIIMGIPMRG